MLLLSHSFEMTEWGDTICSFLKVNKDQHESTAIIGGGAGGGAGSFSTMPLSGRYGTHASNSSTLPMSSPYGTYGLAGPLPTSPGHYGSTPYSPITRGGLSEVCLGLVPGLMFDITFDGCGIDNINSLRICALSQYTLLMMITRPLPLSLSLSCMHMAHLFCIVVLIVWVSQWLNFSIIFHSK